MSFGAPSSSGWPRMTSQRFSWRHLREHDGLAHQWTSNVRPSFWHSIRASATSSPWGEPSVALPVRGMAAGSAQKTRGFGFSSARAGSEARLARRITAAVATSLADRLNRVMSGFLFLLDLGQRPRGRLTHFAIAVVRRLPQGCGGGCIAHADPRQGYRCRPPHGGVGILQQFNELRHYLFGLEATDGANCPLDQRLHGLCGKAGSSPRRGGCAGFRELVTEAAVSV